MTAYQILNIHGQLYDPFCLETKDFKGIKYHLAEVLPRIQRFGGVLKQKYSVAQHTLSMVEYFRLKGNPELEKVAISHELFEAMGIGDIPRPVRNMLPAIEKAERRALTMFAELAGIDPSLYFCSEFREVDTGLFITEALALCPPSEVDWLAYGKPYGSLYKLSAPEGEIKKDFIHAWERIFTPIQKGY